MNVKLVATVCSWLYRRYRLSRRHLANVIKACALPVVLVIAALLCFLVLSFQLAMAFTFGGLGLWVYNSSYRRTYVSTFAYTLLCLSGTYRMAPNICETIFLWISVILCVSRKYWTRKFKFSICSLSQDPLLYKELPAITKWKITLYRSIQFYSYSKPGSVKIATYRHDWASHPVCIVAYPERNLCKIKHQNRDLPLEIMLSCKEQVLLYDTPRNNFANWNSRVYVVEVTCW